MDFPFSGKTYTAYVVDNTFDKSEKWFSIFYRKHDFFEFKRFFYILKFLNTTFIHLLINFSNNLSIGIDTIYIYICWCCFSSKFVKNYMDVMLQTSLCINIIYFIYEIRWKFLIERLIDSKQSEYCVRIFIVEIAAAATPQMESQNKNQTYYQQIAAIHCVCKHNINTSNIFCSYQMNK